jgi:FkbM family methyltransferase
LLLSPPRLPHPRILLSPRERRLLRMSVLRRFTDRVTVRRGGLRWTLLTWDEDVSWCVYADGDYQGPERTAVVRWLRASRRLLPERDLVIDVGANIGTTAVPLARETSCRVLAVEPVPELCELLRRNVEQNGLANLVRCEETAVAAQAGRSETAIPAHSAGSTELLVDALEPSWTGLKATLRRVEVKTAPLPTILRHHRVAPGEVALVWADIQGAEGELIQTGEPLWRAGVPLFMELWPNGLAHRGTDLPAIAEQHFESFVSSCELIRCPESPRWQPIAELRALHDRFIGGNWRAQTDVLLRSRAPATG